MRIERLLAALFAAAFLFLSGAGPAEAASKRVALVIGNSKYIHANPLPNPANDARLIAAALKKAGFEVLERTDLDRIGMSESIIEFTELAYDADVALIYYAGHGIQVEGSNYLIPVDAMLTAPAHIKTRTTSIDALVEALPPDPAVGIVILDACRDNPLSASMMASLPATRSLAVGTGLAPVQTVDAGIGAGGILIAYATDPGAVAVDGAGENSPYSIALAKHLTTPGLELQGALTRVRGDVTSATLGRQRPWHNASLGREIFLGGEAAQPSGEPEVSLVERVLWEEASKRDTADFYLAYLEQYPQGHFSTVARLNVERLRKQAPDAEASKASAPDDQARTARADPVLVLGASTNGAAAIQEPEDDGRSTSTAMDEAALALDEPRRRDLQLRLAALGLEPGPIDGDLGKGSRRAIAKWQQSAGFEPTGFLSGREYAALAAATDPLMPELRLRHQASLDLDRQPQSPVLLAPPAEAEPDEPPAPAIAPVAEPPPQPANGKQQILRKKTSEERQRKPTEKKAAPDKKVVKKRVPTVQAKKPTPKKTERKQVAKAPPKKPPPAYKVIGRDDIFGTGTIYGND